MFKAKMTKKNLQSNILKNDIVPIGTFKGKYILDIVKKKISNNGNNGVIFVPSKYKGLNATILIHE